MSGAMRGPTSANAGASRVSGFEAGEGVKERIRRWERLIIISPIRLCCDPYVGSQFKRGKASTVSRRTNPSTG